MTALKGALVSFMPTFAIPIPNVTNSWSSGDRS